MYIIRHRNSTEIIENCRWGIRQPFQTKKRTIAQLQRLYVNNHNPGENYWRLYRLVSRFRFFLLVRNVIVYPKTKKKLKQPYFITILHYSRTNSIHDPLLYLLSHKHTTYILSIYFQLYTYKCETHKIYGIYLNLWK